MWSRTWTALQRAAKQSMEPGKPMEPVEMFCFAGKEALKKWEVFSDADHGGRSHVKWEWTDGKDGGEACFHGHLRTDVDEKSRLTRSGFCGIRSLPPSSGHLPMEACNVITFRVFGDGRRYIASLRTDNWIAPPGAPPDLWQAVLDPPPGTWHTVRLPLDAFLLTWKGRLVDTLETLPDNRVVSVGIAAACEADVAQPGPFALRLAAIGAERDLSLL